MKSGAYPGSQAGVADMFAYDQDQQDWYPAGYWLWNLRGQIAANLSSGNFGSNLPIFSMYLNDLPAIESWTSAQMGGKAPAPEQHHRATRSPSPAPVTRPRRWAPRPA